MKFITTITAILASIIVCGSLFVSTTFGQAPFKSGDILVPEQVPSNSQVEIRVKSEAKFVTIKVRKTLFDIVKIYELDNGTRDRVTLAKDLVLLQKEVKSSDRVYIFTGEDGLYLIEVTYFDPELGIKEDIAKVVIGDLNPVTASLSADKTAIKEGDGRVTITARLNKESDKPVTVSLKFGGVALPLEDYGVDPMSGEITIPAGSLSGKLFITPIKDDKAEGEESVEVSINKVANAKLGATNTSVRFVIQDDDLPPPPPPDDLEAKIKTALDTVPSATKNEMVNVRQPDGNTIKVKASVAVAQQYGDIAREAEKNPNSWDVATMVDESKVRVGGVIPTSSLSKWLSFFKELTKLQKDLNVDDMNDWIKFFKSVEKVLKGA